MYTKVKQSYSKSCGTRINKHNDKDNDDNNIKY